MILAGLPGVDDVVKWFADPAGSAFAAMVDGFGGWMVESLDYAMQAMLGLFAHQTSPDVTADWFAGAGSPYQVMWRLSLSLMVLLWCVAVIQGVVTGDMGEVGRRLVTRTPVAVLGTALALVVTKEMLAFTDAVSAGIAGDAPQNFSNFMAKILEMSEVQGSMSMLLLLLCGLLFLLAVLIISVELVVRSAVLYLVLAVAPLALAMMIWPATTDTAKKVFKLWLGLLLLKPMIALALAVGSAALGAGLDVQTTQAFADGGSITVSGGQTLGAMVTGMAVLGLAAASPMMMAKLFPLAEGAMVSSNARHEGMATVRNSVLSAKLSGATVAKMAAAGPGAAAVPTAAGGSSGSATGPVGDAAKGTATKAASTTASSSPSIASSSAPSDRDARATAGSSTKGSADGRNGTAPMQADV